jgi:hypothetical protein
MTSRNVAEDDFEHAQMENDSIHDKFVGKSLEYHFGEDVLIFSQRVFAAIFLRFIGEIDK